MKIDTLQYEGYFHAKDDVGGSNPSLPTIMIWEVAQLVEHVKYPLTFIGVCLH